MPSVEIICIDQTEPLIFSGMPFRVYAENKLISHRTPSPLFQSDFNQLTGCIYHLCKHHKGAYTAGDMVTSWEILHFEPNAVSFIQKLLQELLQASPAKELLFTSDYQFGPDVRRYKRPLKLQRFWALHNAMKLHYNALYRLIRD